MKKSLWIILIIGLILVVGFFFFNFNKNDNNNSYIAQRSNTQTNQVKETNIVEKEISSFTTSIHNKEEERQNNISITTSLLNNTIVEPSQTFSFCDTVGKATYAKGYEEADVYSNGELVQALGGGNCQVSTTYIMQF